MSIYLDRGDICSNTVWNFSPTNCTLLWIWKAVCDDHVKECHYSMFFNWEEKFSVNWVGEASNQIIWEKSNKQRRMLSRSMSLQIGWDSNGERFWSNIPCHYWPCFRRPITMVAGAPSLRGAALLPDMISDGGRTRSNMFGYSSLCFSFEVNDRFSFETCCYETFFLYCFHTSFKIWKRVQYREIKITNPPVGWSKKFQNTLIVFSFSVQSCLGIFYRTSWDSKDIGSYLRSILQSSVFQSLENLGSNPH